MLPSQMLGATLPWGELHHDDDDDDDDVVPELRGPVELPSGERQCAGAPVGASWWMVQNNQTSSTPEPGEEITERAS
jgi:hypothetical protein